MAIYRQIYMSFWEDSKVCDEFSPEDKYFYLYLLTNSNTNICGCYEIGIKKMVAETGYSQDTVLTLLDRMEKIHRVIRYSPETKEVLLINWHKYNWSNSPKVKSALDDSYKTIKNPEFKAYIQALINCDDTVSIQYPYSMDTTVTVAVTDTVAVDNLDCHVDVITPGGDRTDTMFDDFWALYPKKVDKKKARAAFEKLDPDDTLFDTIINALKKQKTSDQWVRGYIPNPTTWLNGERWNDDIPKTPQASKKYGDYMQREPIPNDRFGMEYLDEIGKDDE